MEPTPTADPPELAPLSSYQSFTTQRINRKDLKNAPYNPRRPLNEGERRKLRTLLKKHGLVNAIVWNKRTGIVVGGHKRLELLDALHGNDNYSLDVNVIDVDDARERELNIALNNQEAAADYDLDKLSLMRDEAVKLDLDATGFDAADVFNLFGDSPFEHRAEDLEKLGENLRSFREQVDGGHDRAVAKHSMNTFYTVLVWESEAAFDAAHRTLGLSEARFQDGRDILRKLGHLPEDD